MPALAASGTQTATIGTEHTLSTLTTNFTFVLVVDAAAMINSDELELRIYTTVLAAGVERLAYYAVFIHAQAEPAKFSVPVPSDISAKFTLKQVAGVGRAFPFKVLSL